MNQFAAATILALFATGTHGKLSTEDNGCLANISLILS